MAHNRHSISNLIDNNLFDTFSLFTTVVILLSTVVIDQHSLGPAGSHQADPSRIAKTHSQLLQICLVTMQFRGADVHYIG